ncbi:MAG: hypothetical protein V1706_01915 [Pseudomonadota bacterium]
MKNNKRMIKMVVGFAVMAGFVSGGASGVLAGSDMEAMMAEGIAYETPATTQKVIMSKDDSRAGMAAVMVEGIAYPDSIRAEDALVAKIDHRLATVESMEHCLCEDGSASIEDMIATYEEKTLNIMPAAGKAK